MLLFTLILVDGQSRLLDDKLRSPGYAIPGPDTWRSVQKVSVFSPMSLFGVLGECHRFGGKILIRDPSFEFGGDHANHIREHEGQNANHPQKQDEQRRILIRMMFTRRNVHGQ